MFFMSIRYAAGSTCAGVDSTCQLCCAPLLVRLAAGAVLLSRLTNLRGLGWASDAGVKWEPVEAMAWAADADGGGGSASGAPGPATACQAGVRTHGSCKQPRVPYGALRRCACSQLWAARLPQGCC